jgi:hypothetical protein
MSSRHGKVKHFQTSSLLPKKDIKSSYNEWNVEAIIVHLYFKIIICYRDNLNITEQQNNHIIGKAGISIGGTQYLKIIHTLLQFLFHCSVEIDKHIQ